MAKILITYPFASRRIEDLRRRHEVIVLSRGTEVTEALLCREAAGCEALAVLLLHRVTERVLEAAPRLRIIAAVAVGYDNIDVEAARRRGIYVTNTPDVLTRATADLTWALILACARRLVEADRFLREGRFSGWAPELFIGMDLNGKQLGIVGMGRIGREVAGRAGAFGMSVCWSDLSERSDASDLSGACPLPLETLLEESDVVSLHVPLTAGTRHLLSRERLFRMKPGAILINTSRGPVVEEAALVEVLEAGRLRAAGLDVYENEPAVHPGLLALPQAVLLPHIGSAGEDTRRRMADLALENIARVLEGGRPLTNIWSLD
jgi:glyoxylate reductase